MTNRAGSLDGTARTVPLKEQLRAAVILDRAPLTAR
jgi:hypothetical protein